jgi:hypothetical protein
MRYTGRLENLILSETLRARHLLQLDEDFKAGKITGDEYTEQRTKLKQTLGSLREELSRMGEVA